MRVVVGFFSLTYTVVFTFDILEISFVQANTDTCGHSNKVAEISSNNTGRLFVCLSLLFLLCMITIILESSSINIKDGDSDHDDTNSKVSHILPPLP